MQTRHHNRWQYFCEQASTAREFYIPYLQQHMTLAAGSRVLEVGCGEGGNLLPFAAAGCMVTGIDLSKDRIEQARSFFESSGMQGNFICGDFIAMNPPATASDGYDVILVHDVIERVPQAAKLPFLHHMASFLRYGGLVFVGFPPWRNPFGGHQQIGRGLASKMPYVHLLPGASYPWALRMCGNDDATVKELLDIKESKMPVRRFEKLAVAAGFEIAHRTLWFINPHYKQKFHLQPRRLWQVFASIPYLSDFYTTAAFFLLRTSR